MCVNYAPIQRQVLRDIFGVEPPSRLWADEAWPDTLAPIVTASDAGRACALASFSMVPKRQIPPGTRYFPTANARAETVGTLKSFARFWKAGQLALIPASAFYEYAYPEQGTPERPGKPVRWKLWLPDAPASASPASGARGRTTRCLSPCSLSMPMPTRCCHACTGPAPRSARW